MSDTQTIDWKSLLGEEKEKPYFKQALDFVQSERQKGKLIYPEAADVFNALKYTPFEDIRVVIIGQDPYHGRGQAHGLCFSVQPGVTIPPSLRNIYKELHDDIGFVIPNHGCLTPWTKQGVLLLNSILTVEAKKPGSHANIGWQTFTDKIIQCINEHTQGTVFLLWGSYAQRKGESIDRRKHHVLTTTHPSPFSAHNGFLGCKHFSKTNALLKAQGRSEINWQV